MGPFDPIQIHFFRKFGQNFSKNESNIGSIFRTSAEHPSRSARVVPPELQENLQEIH